MTAHTPGPWVIKDERRVFGGRGLVSECRVPLANDPGDDELESPAVVAAEAEAAANAQLIAAAPELLEAAKALLAAFDAVDLLDVEGVAETGAAEMALRSAVAKAEGR